MSRLSYAKKTYMMCRKIHKLRGGMTLRYFADAMKCSYEHGTSPENYFVLRFFELSQEERETYLTSGRSKKADKYLNRNASEEDRKTLASKHLFNKAFKGLVKREFVYAPEADFDEFQAFCKANSEFIIKPDKGTQGKGVKKVSALEIEDKKSFFSELQKSSFLIEQVIKQHSELSKINPYSINSIRINAARGDKGITLIGACIKCGVGNQISDNFHAGGIAYPVDLKTGRITGPGRNNADLNEFKYHPGTGIEMPGFKIPMWDKVIECVYKGMDMVKSLGYIGWDIALTPDGPEIIEGNFSWPGGNIIQFDRVGKYPIILSCCGERNE